MMKRIKCMMLALVACALALPASAQEHSAMTYQMLVDAQVLPMALANDAPGEISDTFTDEELTRIVAAVQENDLAVPDSLQRALENGEGYWEEETIMALAKAAFGPIPARWTLEEQFWFEETVVAIGFKDCNSRRVPGEGELSYEQALAKAEAYLAESCGAGDLRDARAYAIACTYQAWVDEDGTPHGPYWYFDFEPQETSRAEYTVTLDVRGDVVCTQDENG